MHGTDAALATKGLALGTTACLAVDAATGGSPPAAGAAADSPCGMALVGGALPVDSAGVGNGPTASTASDVEETLRARAGTDRTLLSEEARFPALLRPRFCPMARPRREQATSLGHSDTQATSLPQKNWLQAA